DDGAAVGPGGSAVGGNDGSAATGELAAGELAAGAGRATPAGLAEHATRGPHASPTATTSMERLDGADMRLPRCRGGAGAACAKAAAEASGYAPRPGVRAEFTGQTAVTRPTSRGP